MYKKADEAVFTIYTLLLYIYFFYFNFFFFFFHYEYSLLRDMHVRA